MIILINYIDTKILLTNKYSNAVRCLYNMIKYNMILYTALYNLEQNINQIVLTTDTPYLTLMGELWGVL